LAEGNRIAATTADGIEVAVHDLGGRGPALLMAHATGFCGMAFAPLAAELRSSFRCYAIDERGHGESGRPPRGDFAWRGFAYDVLAAADVLGPPTLFGMGHSCGGAALLLAELERPGTLEAMYLFEPIVFSPPQAADGPAPDLRVENPMSAAARRRRDNFSSREEAYSNYASKPPLSSLRADALRAYVEHGFEDVPGDGVRLRCRPSDEAEVFAMAPANGAYERLGEIPCPATVAQGERSDTFPEGHARLLASLMPAAEAETLPCVGHFGPLEDPPRVAASMRAALLRRNGGTLRPRRRKTAHPPVV
jgi:pimeloyl-ACP methyl ester carboxylesterase